MAHLGRITQKPDVMGGKACIRGLRVTVGMIVGQIGAGRGIEQVRADFPYLEREDILQAQRYAALRAEEHEVAREVIPVRGYSAPSSSNSEPHQQCESMGHTGACQAARLRYPC